MTTEKRQTVEEKVVMTACSSHCGGNCLLKVHVRDGIITRIETDDGEEPQLRACLRCRAYRQRVYDPLRIKFPMKRTGGRGEGKFERISWGEALDKIVNELNRVRSIYGPSAVLFLGGGGDAMRLHRSALVQELIYITGGCTNRWGWYSFERGLFATLANYETCKKKGVYRVPLSEPRIVFKEQIEDPEHRSFPTPSGKIEIYSQRLADMGNPEIPPIPKYIEPWEGRNDPLIAKYPLQLITTHFKRRTHTQFDSLPWLKELLPQMILINPIDAQRRGIRDGEEVRVYNDRGVVRIPARVTERIMPGVVDLPQGAWYSPDEEGVDRGGCANVLTKDAKSPGGAACHNTCLVQIEKI